MSLRGTSRKASELELEDDDDVVDKMSSSQASSSSNDVFKKVPTNILCHFPDFELLKIVLYNKITS